MLVYNNMKNIEIDEYIVYSGAMDVPSQLIIYDMVNDEISVRSEQVNILDDKWIDYERVTDRDEFVLVVLEEHGLKREVYERAVPEQLIEIEYWS